MRDGTICYLAYSQSMETGLKGRVAMVAGSSQGIGRATALAFAAEGANLALCARNQQALDEVAAEAKQRHGVETFRAKVDVADDPAVRAFVEQTHGRFGRLDICVTNAGGPPAKQFAQTTMQEWDNAYALNLRSIVSFAQAVLPLMKQQKWGRMVTITSISVKQPVPSLILSNSIRTGVLGLVRSLAGQYGEFGITVNNVGPGYTATDRLKDLASTVPGKTESEYFAMLAQEVPLKRIAKPEEVADAIVWLASERASYITGQTILVDGGAYRGL
jgi:3-oxoacyl-[acyl-carrier protein] reductase